MRLRRTALAALLLLAAAAQARALEQPSAAPAPATRPEAPGQQVSTGLESALPRRCGLCHPDKAPAAVPGRMAFAPPGRGGAGDSDVCYSCHNGIVRDDRRAHWTGRNHPASGKVSCGSCHTPHLKASNAGTFMRFPPGSYGFCASCHPGRRPGESGEHPVIGGDKARAQDCGTCHMAHRASGDGLIRATGAEVLCGPCHGENPSKAGKGPGTATHLIGKNGPQCLECHSVHRTSGGKMMLRASALDGGFCRRCHPKQGSDGPREPNHPVASGRVACLSCHRIHNAEKTKSRRGLLAVPWSEADSICRRCHADLAGAAPPGQWSHPVGESVAGAEGVLSERLVRAGGLFALGGRITCLTCHRTHAGQEGTSQLVTPVFTLCLHCHPQQNTLDRERARPGAHPVSVKPKRARIDEAFVKAGGLKGPGGELICATCHRAHRSKLVLAPETYSCLLCHPRHQAVASTAHSRPAAPAGAKGAAGPGMCGACHGEHGWKLTTERPIDGRDAIESLCGACHKSAPTNHPVGIAPPRGSTPSGLPLFWTDGRRLLRGSLTCATCHDVHRAGALGKFLRESPAGGGREVCVACHAEQSAIAATRHDLVRTQGSTCGPCHRVHDAASAGSWPSRRGGGDRTAADLGDFCGSCHRAGGPAAAKVVAERFHPPTAPAGKPGGRVGCVGCHDPHRWNPNDANDRGLSADGDARTKFLVRSAAGPTDLCAGCHAAQMAVAGTPHDLVKSGEGAAGVCAPCHRVHGAQPIAVAALPSRDPAEKAAAGTDHCAACHAPGQAAAKVMVGGSGHPVGLGTGHDYGPDLPLFGVNGRRQLRGRIGCATCHDVHALSPPGGSGAPSKSAKSFLRLGADGYSPLCFPCHIDKATVVGTDHDLRVTAPAAVNRAGQNAEASGVCGVCHAAHGGRESWVLWNRGLGEGRDSVSRACTGCHTPGSAEGARVPPRQEAHLVNFPGRGLVSRLFTITRTAAAGGETIPLYDDAGEKAEKGYLSCPSCHDVHRWQSDGASSGPGTPTEGDLSNSFLRVRRSGLDRTLCADCHASSLIEHFRDYHFPRSADPPRAGP